MSTETLSDVQEFAERSLSKFNGTITLYNANTGGHRTFRIRTQKETAKFAPGKRVLSLMVGPDNERSFKGFAFVDGNLIFVWKRYRGNGPSKTDWEKYAHMLMFPDKYREIGVEYTFSVRCRICNRKLTTPESIRTGVGPVCGKRA